MTHQQKMYISATLWVVSVVVVFGYLLFVLRTSNETLAEETHSLRRQYDSIKAEQDRFTFGKEQVMQLETKTYQPELFFSTDTRLVKEIATLEDLAKQHNLTMNLSVAGTLDKAVKVPDTSGDVYKVPYSIVAKGSVSDIEQFLKAMEAIYFITHVQSISLAGDQAGSISATINANFFLKKP